MQEIPIAEKKLTHRLKSKSNKAKHKHVKFEDEIIDKEELSIGNHNQRAIDSFNSFRSTFKKLTKNFEKAPRLEEMVKTLRKKYSFDSYYKRRNNKTDETNFNSANISKEEVPTMSLNRFGVEKLQEFLPWKKFEIREVINTFNNTITRSKQTVLPLKPLSEYQIEELNKYMPWKKATNKSIALKTDLSVAHKTLGNIKINYTNLKDSLNVPYLASKSFIQGNEKSYGNINNLSSRSYIDYGQIKHSRKSYDLSKSRHIMSAIVGSDYMKNHINCNPNDKFSDPGNYKNIINELNNVSNLLDGIKEPLKELSINTRFKNNENTYDGNKIKNDTNIISIEEVTSDLENISTDIVQPKKKIIDKTIGIVKKQVKRINTLNNITNDLNKKQNNAKEQENEKSPKKIKQVNIRWIKCQNNKNDNENLKHDEEEVLTVIEPSDIDATDNPSFSRETERTSIKKNATKSSRKKELPNKTNKGDDATNKNETSQPLTNLKGKIKDPGEIKNFLKDLRNILNVPSKKDELLKELHQADRIQRKISNSDSEFTNPDYINKILLDMSNMVSKAGSISKMNKSCNPTEIIIESDQSNDNIKTDLNELTGFDERMIKDD